MNKKNTKLRNTEYYNFQATQDMLYEQSKNNKIFKNLMNIITKKENILLAYRNIKKNKGSKTPGTDKKTILDIEKWNTENFIKHINKKLEWYEPKAIRRVEIPKANGKTRALGIPTIMDRIIQQCILQVLEPICEAKFHERNNGFRPCRSAENAIAQVYRHAQRQNLYYVIDIDIKGFFDNVKHGKLLKQMWNLGIHDKKLLCIISKMLKSEVAEIGFPEKGTPQGGIISPLLANIVLNELDWWIDSQWENIKTKTEYVSQSHKYRAIRKTKLKECYIIRYADDFKIFCRNKNDAEKLFIATKLWLKERLGLEISKEKSKIVNLKNTYSDYLGFRIKVYPKGNKLVVKSRINDKNIKRIKEKSKQLIIDMQKARTREEFYKTTQNYNAFIMGIHNYYQFATYVNKDFKRIAFEVKRTIKRKLKNIVKRNRTNNNLNNNIPEKYLKSKEVRYIYNYQIIPIGYIQTKKPMYKRNNINKYTKEGRKEIHREISTINPYKLIYLMKNYIPNRSIEYNDNRIAVYVAQKGKCKITGKELEIENIHCHHIIARKQKGTDKYENLICVSKQIHKLIHATNKDIIEECITQLELTEENIKKINIYRDKLKLNEIKI